MFWLKALLSGLLIAAASEVGRRNALLGAIIGSLPLVSMVAMMWMWKGGSDSEQLARYAFATFWFVLPSLPAFLLMPALLRGGLPFWLALAAGAALTVALYAGTMWLLPRIGIQL